MDNKNATILQISCLATKKLNIKCVCHLDIVYINKVDKKNKKFEDLNLAWLQCHYNLK